jgi:selT/selW/selH-like putative selenoprotein
VEIEERFGVQPRLIKGSGGTFDVRADGELVFSKKKVGRFPQPGEVALALEPRLAG